MILAGYFHVGALWCSLCRFNIFVARAVFSMDACFLFPHCVLDIIHLIGVVDWYCGDKSLLWSLQGLLFALWLLQPFWEQALLPICWIISSQIHFWAVVWGGKNWNSPAGRGANKYSFPGAVHCGLCSVLWLAIHSVDSQLTLLLALPSALLQPWQSQQLALVSIRCCLYREDLHKDPLNSGTRLQ